ncbi:MAG: aspartate/glutamate racemase family protein [Pseudomonadota bacterium]
MKPIGILGGMSWQSTQLYYRLINEAVGRELGGLHSAELLIDSLDFATFDRLQRANDWAAMGADLARRAMGLEAAGAQAMLIGSNTMHRVADTVAEAIQVPLIHLVDEVGAHAAHRGWGRLALLGTRFTMSGSLYPERLATRGIEVVAPDGADADRIDAIIFEELCLGELRPESRTFYLEVVAGLAAAGCDAVILGCTEIGLLLDTDEDCPLPRIDSAEIHAQAAVRFALDR